MCGMLNWSRPQGVPAGPSGGGTMDAIGDDRSPWNGDGHPLALAGVPLLQYQPVIDLGSGQLLGFEALLRWRHPTEGIILPPQLIPWAEASGDIIEIGEWVL